MDYVHTCFMLVGCKVFEDLHAVEPAFCLMLITPTLEMLRRLLFTTGLNRSRSVYFNSCVCLVVPRSLGCHVSPSSRLKTYIHVLIFLIVWCFRLRVHVCLGKRTLSIIASLAVY